MRWRCVRGLPSVRTTEVLMKTFLLHFRTQLGNRQVLRRSTDSEDAENLHIIRLARTQLGHNDELTKEDEQKLVALVLRFNHLKFVVSSDTLPSVKLDPNSNVSPATKEEKVDHATPCKPCEGNP